MNSFAVVHVLYYRLVCRCFSLCCSSFRYLAFDCDIAIVGLVNERIGYDPCSLLPYNLPNVSLCCDPCRYVPCDCHNAIVGLIHKLIRYHRVCVWLFHVTIDCEGFTHEGTRYHI